MGRRLAPVSAAHEPGRDRPPAAGVVDEQAWPARGSAGQQHPVAVQVELVPGHLADPVQQLVAVQARVADQLVEVLHQQGPGEYRQVRQVEGLVAERAGFGEPPPVERRVGGGVADDGLQAPLLVLSKLGTWLLLPADLRPRQPHGLGHVGQAPPVISNLGAVHRILRSCWVPSLPAESWVAPKAASSSSRPMRRASTTSTVCGWVSRSRPSPTSIAFQARAT